MSGKFFIFNRLVYLFFILLVTLVFISCEDQIIDPQAAIGSDDHDALSAVQPQRSTDYVEGTLPSGAIYRIYTADDWNGDLVVFAHGYVSALEPLGIPGDQLLIPDGTSIPELVNDLGYAFATTSYRYNGLIVGDAIIDLVELVYQFNDLFPDAGRVYLVGASEGGLITVKTVERFKTIFSGGLALCGPIGDFRKQIDYMGDFRVVFDYFFPRILPGSAIEIPAEVQQNWETVYVPRIIRAISADPQATLELLRVSGAPFDPADETTIGQTVLGLLWYNVFATNDARRKLGGNPFDNRDRRYRGSADDARLNRTVQRFQADEPALRKISSEIETSGKPRLPLVTMHTMGDEIVPGWHQRMYKNKVLESGYFGLHNSIPVLRYGHCNFTTDEVLDGFALLVLKVTARELLPPTPDVFTFSRELN